MGIITDLFSKENACRLLVNLEGLIAQKYKWYREFLIHNREALQIISELELLHKESRPFTLTAVKCRFDHLFTAVGKLVTALNILSGGRYDELVHICASIDAQIQPLFDMPAPKRSKDWVLPLEALQEEMTDIAGSKATTLAVIGNVLGLPVPPGFVVTANAFWFFLEHHKLDQPIDDMLADLAPDAADALEPVAEAIQKKILLAPMPPPLEESIVKAYEQLEKKTREGVPIAMRSTAVGEDTEASFAGQYTTVLNVGKNNLMDAYKTVLASKYSPRAIRYRVRSGLDDRATPMCVAGIAMIAAKASGVVYTADPSRYASSEMLISATWGLGEHLVSGAASPDTFYVDRKTGHILKREINPKPYRMVALKEGGIRLEETPVAQRDTAAINDKTVEALMQHGLKVENHFGAPQDIEWCIDHDDQLFILQSRPLGLLQSRPQDIPRSKDFFGHTVLLSQGNRASGGTVSGRVLLASSLRGGDIPPDTILVAKTASPEYAKYVGSVKGIITDLGSVASHLASVAREFGIPMIVQTHNASSTLPNGTIITMLADTATVYAGQIVAATESAQSVSLPKNEIFENPARRRMHAIMASISPLNLTDPQAPSFTPKHCKTIHDVIRYSHEMVVKEMFTTAGSSGGAIQSVKMTANIPLAIYFIDLGGGLRGGLTTCDGITPDSIASFPMKALWRGLSHPGISWAGAVHVTAKNLMALMTSGPPPQMASYVVLSDEYVNLSFKFGYHFTNLDVLCTNEPEDNYIALQFGGGAGSYFGRSMRIRFLSEVLQRLGFTLNISGDLLGADKRGYDRASMEETLDQLGRLLAVSRLLDLAIPSEDHVARLVEAFFSGDYGFLGHTEEPLPDFYTLTGEWKRVEKEGRTGCFQGGTGREDGFACTFKNIMGKMVGNKYQEFLDGIHAFHYFPLAVLKESYLTDGTIRVTMELEGGCVDRTGGLAFALKNFGNYFVLSLDALSNTISLFEFINNRRVTRQVAAKRIESRRRYALTVEIAGSSLNGYVDRHLVVAHDGQKALDGYIGLWSKADSRVYFEELTIIKGDQKRMARF